MKYTIEQYNEAETNELPLLECPKWMQEMFDECPGKHTIGWTIVDGRVEWPRCSGNTGTVPEWTYQISKEWAQSQVRIVSEPPKVITGVSVADLRALGITGMYALGEDYEVYKITGSVLRDVTNSASVLAEWIMEDKAQLVSSTDELDIPKDTTEYPILKRSKLMKNVVCFSSLHWGVLVENAKYSSAQLFEPNYWERHDNEEVWEDV